MEEMEPPLELIDLKIWEEILKLGLRIPQEINQITTMLILTKTPEFQELISRISRTGVKEILRILQWECQVI